MLGFAYVPLGVGALALGSKHHAGRERTLHGRRLRAPLVSGQPPRDASSATTRRDSSPASWCSAGASLLALQAAALASRDALVAAPGAACAATVIIGSSLAALNARKVSRWIGRLGIVGGLAVLGVGVSEAAARLDVRRLDLLGLLARLHDLGARHRHLPRRGASRWSAHGIFRPPAAHNEPAHDFAPGSAERERLAEAARGRWPASGSRSRSSSAARTSPPARPDRR